SDSVARFGSLADARMLEIEPLAREMSGKSDITPPLLFENRFGISNPEENVPRGAHPPIHREPLGRGVGVLLDGVDLGHDRGLREVRPAQVRFQVGGPDLQEIDGPSRSWSRLDHGGGPSGNAPPAEPHPAVPDLTGQLPLVPRRRLEDRLGRPVFDSLAL